MLHDPLTVGGVVDSESALEFMKEATKLATSADLEDLSERMAKKSVLFGRLLKSEKLKQLTEEEFRQLVRQIFSIGRKSNRLISANGFENLRAWIIYLLYGDEKLVERFNGFIQQVQGIEEKMRINFASELLHFRCPAKNWLWTNWIWDPDANTGALPLVIQEEVDLLGETPGETYMMVGTAMLQVNKVGQQRGFSKVGQGDFGIDVFLACVYAVYMYTVFRVKLSDEFNRILPALPELTRRVLGVEKMEC